MVESRLVKPGSCQARASNSRPVDGRGPTGSCPRVDGAFRRVPYCSRRTRSQWNEGLRRHVPFQQEKTPTEWQQSSAQVEAERRRELKADADQSLENILALLDRHIQDNASSVQTSSGSSLKRWELNSAAIWLDFLKAVGLGRDQHLPFEVVAHTKISVSRPADRSGYRGRSHSLWYCDAQEQGVFRWFETAFMETFGANIPFAPSAMPPDSSDAATAISPGLHTYQLARPFIPIDQGDEESFIERWMGWLGEAAQGQLLYPSQLPELDTQGSWRRGS